jgi:hypothetical protein
MSREPTPAEQRAAWLREYQPPANGRVRPPHGNRKDMPGGLAGKAYAVLLKAGRPLPLGELAMRCYIANPGDFECQLDDGTAFCTRKVYSLFVGKRGLLKKGLIRSLGNGLYEAVRLEEQRP